LFVGDRCRRIIVAMDIVAAPSGPRVARMPPAGIDVTELVAFLERETAGAIDILNPSWLIFCEGFRHGSIRRFTSEMFDLFASLLIFLVALPTMVAVALAIKLEDGWRRPGAVSPGAGRPGGGRFSC